MQRLGDEPRRIAAEVALRGLGLLLLCLCALAVGLLYRWVHQPPTHQPSARELLAGLAAVPCWCLGTSLTVQGPGLFSLVPDPRRNPITISIRGHSR